MLKIRDNWIVVRQKGSHIRLEKKLPDETLKITVPAHKPVKRSTLAKILKQARIDLDYFLELL
jgi:predicted RNA binding protein YcfA (HicA-like mRNA interferase family)